MDQQQYKENYIANSSDYHRALSDYLHNTVGVPRRNDWIPFYVEMVDSNGNLTAIPYPPVEGNTGGRQILGIKLMINPSSMSQNMSKIVNRTQTMVGWVEEHWGEELDTITFQGSTAAFLSGAVSMRNAREAAEKSATDKAQARADFYAQQGLTQSSTPYQTSVEGSAARRQLEMEPGLTTMFRRESVSYKEFKLLMELLTANGLQYDKQGFVSDRKFIQLTYDYGSWIGYFESMDVVEEATNPFRFTYTITFKSEKAVYSFVTRDI